MGVVKSVLLSALGVIGGLVCGGMAVFTAYAIALALAVPPLSWPYLAGLVVFFTGYGAFRPSRFTVLLAPLALIMSPDGGGTWGGWLGPVIAFSMVLGGGALIGGVFFQASTVAIVGAAGFWWPLLSSPRNASIEISAPTD